MKTVEDVIAGLREVVKGKEDYVYKSPVEGEDCAYSTPTGEASCGVGAWFCSYDPELFAELHKEEWSRGLAWDSESEEVEVWHLEPKQVTSIELPDYTADAIGALSVFQRSQDRLNTWGVSLQKVLAEYENKAEEN